ncbi:MAG: hypothetical protein ACOZQL_11175 [Myxococcota bacterium]
MKLLRVTLGAVLLSLGGCTCETVNSSDIKTSGLYADLEVTADGTGRSAAKATLTLGAGSLTFLELASGDSLTVRSGTDSKAMSRRSLLGSTWYEAELTGEEANKAFTVSLTRANDTSAPSSSVTLPAPFSLTAPMASQTFSRAGSGQVVVAWAPSGLADAMHVAASGSCIESIPDADLNADQGQYTLPAFRARQGEDSTTCSVVITVTRTRKGSVDPAYGKGGDFTATVKRTVTISSAP